PTVFATTSTCQPVGTAIDGQGNVFYTCNNETNIYELVGGTGTAVPIPITYGGTDYATDDHLSVDAAGNLYPTSYRPATNLFFKVDATSHAVSLLATAPSGARFVGAVTDAAGNTFAPDYNNNILYELPAGTNTLKTLFSGAPLQAPHAIAEDAAGNLYVTTTTPNTTGAGNSNLLRFATGSYTLTPANISVPGGDSLYITPDGDFYTVYSNSTLAVYSRSLFSLTFPATVVGQVSPTQTVTLENDGTAPLTISAPSTGNNPSVSQNFTYDPNSGCPQLSPASNSITLAAGASCSQVVAFTPLQAGSITGSIVTTDNSANTPGSMQTISMSGTGMPGTPVVTVDNVSGTLGQSVTLRAVVSFGGVTPSGAVMFSAGSGAAVAGTCNVSGSSEVCTATYPTRTGVGAGNNTITASLASDGNYLAASGTGTLALAGAPTTATVTSSANPSVYGTAVTLTGKVASTYATPSGQITFYDGSTALGTGVLNASGVATLNTSSLLGGSHSITVGYAAQGNFAASTSPAITQTVNKSSSFTNSLTSSNTTPSFGSLVTFTDTLTSSVGVAPSGTVTFYSNGSQIGTGSVNSSGVATFSTSTLRVGNSSITASYGGDTNYNTSSAGPVSENVVPASVLSSLATSNAAPVYGSSVTLTDTLP
ncbi:MAG: Ig-like domain repeat protein, partial [Rhodospirillales bacterium]|nr:Ig-like domain repeat protein [Acetobacter sp.]